VTAAIRQLVAALVRHRGSLALALAGLALLAWLLVSDDLNGLLGGGSG
jgi:hypothetical protein